MLTKINDIHRSRFACVYIRQSTIEQVRSNRESTRRQQNLVERAEQLGWKKKQTILIDEDLGKSAAITTDERPGYQKLLHLVSTKQVGIILAVEVSRLARDNISWQIMFRHCQFMNVLLADEEHVYDPVDPHEQMMLGLLATFAGFELKVLHQRMQQAWKQKAQRGELYCGCAPGYVIEDNQTLKKTPDQRVQHAIELILEQFPLHPSVSALCRWGYQHGLQIPVCRDFYGRNIEWKAPTIDALIRMLRNPVYTGTYVMGKTKTVETLLPDGQICKQTVKLSMEEWSVVIHDHHEPYISWEQFTRNYRRLQRKTVNQNPAKRAVGTGQAFLPGLLRCRRCGHSLYVRYTRQGKARYLCLSGNKQREGATQTCFSFLGKDLDELIATQLLEVIRPAGVEAALLAAKQLALGFESHRQVLADHVEQSRYEAERARRQYDRVDPENRLVCGELERRWNAGLVRLDESEKRLVEFDRQRPPTLSPAEQESLLDLGRNLQPVWFSSDTSIQIKKQILRLLIEQIIVDVNADNRIQIVVHWTGGHHSEHELQRRTRGSKAQTLDLASTVKSLNLIANDAQLARMLNRAAIRSPKGASWTAERVAGFRHRHRIASHDPKGKERRGLLLQEEAAAKLAISPMSVHRLLTSGILSGSQIGRKLPWLIEADALEAKAVKIAVADIKRSAAASKENPKQLALW